MFLLSNGSYRESSLKCDFSWPPWRKQRGTADELRVGSNWSVDVMLGFLYGSWRKRGTHIESKPTVMDWDRLKDFCILIQDTRTQNHLSNGISFFTRRSHPLLLFYNNINRTLHIVTPPVFAHQLGDGIRGGSSCQESCIVAKLDHLLEQFSGTLLFASSAFREKEKVKNEEKEEAV